MGTSLVHKDTTMYVLCSTVMDLSLCIAFCIVLCCTSDYSTVLYCTIRYFTVLYCTLLHFTVLYCTILYCTVLYCAIPDCVVLYCTVQLCIVQCSTVLWTRPSVNLSFLDSVGTDAIPVPGLG